MADLSVVLAGGGSAGHVNPLLALATELQGQCPGVRLSVLGTAEGLEAELVPAAGLPLTVLPKVPLPRRPSADWFRFPGRWRAAVNTASAAIESAQADVVVGFGGYVATPAYIAAKRRGVPIVVHEQNARPGLANRLGARSAAAVAVTFAGTPLPGAQVVGLPLRAPIADLVASRRTDRAGVAARAAEHLGLDVGRRTILVTGGSLGAQRLNTVLPQVASELINAGAQILHLTGKGKDAAVRAEVATLSPADQSRYHVRAYLADMEHALACADLVIARSGAGTVCELAALGIPAAYVPLPVGNGEQRLNAAPLVAVGGGLLVDDAAFTPQWVKKHVGALLADPAALAAMGERAAAAGVRDAAARLAELVIAAGERS